VHPDGDVLVVKGRLKEVNGSERSTDEGSTLIVVLVMSLICGLIVIPTLRFAAAVIRSAPIHDAKARREEAVKGGLRVAMASPLGLYQTCATAQLTQGIDLAAPQLDIPVSTQCFWISDVNEETVSTLRYGAAATQVGAVAPPVSPGSSNYPDSGAAPPEAWNSDTSEVSEQDTIWLPDLPTHGLNIRSASGYAMPSGYPSCTVYFPGTYVDPLTISGSTPVYFTSGVYYFENDVHFTGNANVVVGFGDTPGCVASDQIAAFYATNAPRTHNISGHGATFVFGGAGRMIVDNAVAGTVSVKFNQRYVSDTDQVTGLGGMSIMSVNGVTDSTTDPNAWVTSDFDLAGSLHVPRSLVSGEPPVQSGAQSYRASTLTPVAATVPPDPPAVPPLPIVDINLTTTGPLTLVIPGYISVPQGVVRVASTSAATSAGKTVSFAGGVLASSFIMSATPPATQFIGLDNPVVQRILKVVSTTTSGTPQVTSTAIVQVNQFGAWAIESWEVQ
jgi:hypothetical protein